MSRRFRLDLAYDGTGFEGWQVQPGRRTIQGELEQIFGRLGDPARPTGAGRTDAGVHALNQVAHVDLARDWNAGELERALRQMVPGDLSIIGLVPAEKNFHSRFDAASRTYHYSLGLTHNAFFQKRSWVVRELPESDWIREELGSVQGEHDFAAFAKSGGGSNTTGCRILALGWTEFEQGAVLSLTADRFLYGMVRALAGTLMRGFEAGTRETLKSVLATGDRSRAGLAAPAEGLYLAGVRYPGEPKSPSRIDDVAGIACLGNPRSETLTVGSDG